MMPPLRRGERKFHVPEEKKNGLYEAVFNIFARDRSQRDMRACICGVPMAHRTKLAELCKELGIDLDGILNELSGYGLLVGKTWDDLVTTKDHPGALCAEGYVFYFFIEKACKHKGIHQFRGFPI